MSEGLCFQTALRSCIRDVQDEQDQAEDDAALQAADVYD